MAITATFEANFDQFVTAVKGATASLEGIKTSATQVGAAITASLASAELRRFAGDVTAMSKEFVGAFAEEEAAVKTLTVALQNQGNLTPAVTAQYAALATAFQQTTVFSDDLIISMQALLVQVGDVAPAQMQEALTAATNLAAGLGIDLQTATMALAKGFEGGTTALIKMVPSMKDVIKEGATMEEVMAIINDRFGGQAQAQIETTGGKFAVLANQMSDVKEQVGELLVNALNPLLAVFTALPQSVQTGVVAIVAISTALAPVALSFAALTTVLTPLIPLIGTALSGAFAALVPFLGPAGLIAAGVVAVYVAFKNWDAIAGYVKGVYDGVATWLGTKLTAILDGLRDRLTAVTGYFRDMYNAVVGHSIVPDMVNGIAAEMGRLSDVMVGPATAATAATVTVFSDMATSVEHTMQRLSVAVAAGGASASAVSESYRQSYGGGGGKGLQLAVPRDFSYTQAYRDAGLFVHDAPFLGKSISTMPELRNQASLGFLPRDQAYTVPTFMTINVDGRNGFYDSPESQARLGQWVGEAVEKQLRGRGASLGSSA